MSEFTDWIQRELDRRNWAQIEITRRGGITSGAVSKVMSGERQPGIEFCGAVARAFNYPLEDVFRAAQILPPKQDDDPLSREAAYLVGLLPDDRKRQVLDYIRFMVEAEKAKKK